MRNAENIVLAPHRGEHAGISLWLDEQIWGHRLWDAQTPWLVFLEFLNVAEGSHRQGKLFTENTDHGPVPYRPYRRMFLRNILFNNDKITEIDERHPDSSTAWQLWLQWMTDHAQEVTPRDFSYLKAHFHSFRDFARLVALLRSSNVENETNKRWTSRFVFPFGANGLYVDLNLDGSREYINFGRTGELLYLMLCRSAHVDALKPHFERMFATNNTWNRLLTILQPETDDDNDRPGSPSYLPYKRHPRFDQLAEDWLTISNLNFPRQDAFSYLVTLGALHVLLYQLAVAAEVAGSPLPHLLCEVVAPRKTLVRERSSENFQQNNLLTEQAIRAFIKVQIEESEEWRSAISSSLTEQEAFARCKQLLSDRLWWSDEYEGLPNPNALLEDLRSVALKRHRQHAANVHRSLGRHLGLISKRGTNKLRYAPTDGLFRALVVANVVDRMELGEFLARLYLRYGFVFGDKEAEIVTDGADFDKKAFQANSRRLEQRLSSLGMLKRLSDSCAYVENPLRRSGR